MDRREHRAPVPVRRLIFLWLLECREETAGWQNQVLEPTVPALLGAGFSGASLVLYWALILASLCSAPPLQLLACKFTSSSSCGVRGAACAALTCRVEGNRLRELGW